MLELKYLSSGRYPVKSIKGLEYAKNLEYLTLSFDEISDISHVLNEKIHHKYFACDGSSLLISSTL